VKLHRTQSGALLEVNGAVHPLDDSWDALLNRDDLLDHLRGIGARGHGGVRIDADFLAPVAGQEVWAAGVTYFRSRDARMAESQDAGGGTFYDRVYDADRPELFFKAAGWRVRGPGQSVRIRADARWSVPEPELALVVNARGVIVGYTIGNDMSSRDIEGENPLYLPQAKSYDGSCALGPAVLVADGPLPPETPISLHIGRHGATAFAGSTTLGAMKRAPEELVGYLFRETTFPMGCVLLTGTGVVPPDHFTLAPGDVITIEIPPIGTLVNQVA
jgi:2-dehydro-3-deoxy-D-arabinonate dehydratase